MTPKSQDKATHDTADASAKGAVDPQPKDFLAAGSAILECFNNMGSEAVSFLAKRIEEDIKTQHDLLQCKTPAEFSHIQAQFIQTAIDQYQAETGKLVEIGKPFWRPIADADKF